MTSVIRAGGVSGQRRDAGFTLIELLVSFAVLAMALTLLVSMFGNSLDLGSEIRHRRAAANIADEVLTEMRLNPASFTWPTPNDQLLNVAKGGEAGMVEAPAVSAITIMGDDHVKQFYRDFKWRTYVRAAAPDSPVCELTVVVFWTDKSKSQRYTLTTLAPRSVTEGKP
ncbi:MAG: prepilin-type N-terminal cleavage/methylation domain-containing protein [Candidatus Hydrogenedentes bacterium]|nr:prepilin-type N-terminal cleavage/methylation domain-containing protein [Candidatus Hydrogenedentota bacterium]